MVDQTANEAVHHPTHYTQAVAAGFEVIDVLEAWQAAGMIDFRLANVIKYVTRHRFKKGLEDLRKAEWYLRRYIQQEYQNG